MFVPSNPRLKSWVTNSLKSVHNRFNGLEGGKLSHSLTKIWIHGIFGTKERAPLIKAEFEKELYKHLTDKLEADLDCKVRIINGMTEHVHVLFMLSSKFSIENVFKNVKGESSHWINQSNFTIRKFAWQTGYAAFSVSESKVGHVERYIRNQKEHHKKMSYAEEIELLMKKYQLKVMSS